MVFQVIERSSRYNQKFKTHTHSVVFKINPPDPEEDPEDAVKRGVEGILNYLLQDLESYDLIGFTFESQDLVRDAYLPFRPAHKVTTMDIQDLLTKIFQSKTVGLNIETFKITSTIVKRFRGGSRKRGYNFKEECYVKKGVIAIKNEGANCLPTALIVSQAYCLNAVNKVQLRRNVGKILDNEVLKLIKNTGIIIPEGGCGFAELELFQNYLRDFQIVVYEWGTGGRNVLFKGPVRDKKLNLLYFDGHFNVITKLTAAFSTPYYCQHCYTPFKFKLGHRCDFTCDSCRIIPQCTGSSMMSCLSCRRVFKNAQCFENHKSLYGGSTRSVCETIQKCPVCLGTIFFNKPHYCDKTYCTICRTHSEIPHLCYMPPAGPLINCDKLLLIFFDLETIIAEDEKLSYHTPILCVSNNRCNVCLNEDNLKICTLCCEREHIFVGKRCIEDFISYVLGVAGAFKKVCVIAHNMGGFDGLFVLKEVLLKIDITPELLMRGSRIIKFSFSNIRFLDSLHYIPFKLALLPKLFDLGDHFKKGYFPHSFNTEANADYVGLLPPTEFYNPDAMTAKDREAFIKWYSENKNKTFNLKQELIEYCRSDVSILTKACIKFREMFLARCSVDVFLETVTIASTCSLVFRRKFLKVGTIGILPTKGYRFANTQSKIALKWLIYEEGRLGVSIHHAGKGREAVIEGWSVDGYFETTDGGNALEFLGCYWHGCPKCFTRNRTAPLSSVDTSDTFDTRYDRTMVRLAVLSSKVHLTYIWECEFRQRMATNPHIEEYTANHPLLNTGPLNPRDGFYGGRVCAVADYYECKQGEKVKYVDITSLYPWVCKYGKVPLGHPKIYISEECEQVDIMSCDGLIKCEIVPNRSLLFPVLPIRVNGKLMFVLCRTCGVELSMSECDHNEEERCLTGTWVLEEVCEAVRNGYRIKKTHEIWVYETASYDPETKTGGIFSDFINEFLKIKQENSGWPEGCNSVEDRQKYIQEYEQHEGITLDYDLIQRNESLRSLAKLILNSFWGKFGQRNNLPSTTIIKVPYQLNELLENMSLNVLSITELSSDSLVVSYEHKDATELPAPNTNVVVAAFTTAFARLKLYSYLKTAGSRVLYYDTDSIIYVSRPGEPDIPTGVYLGDMVNELSKYGEEAYITRFCSGGAKNYAFEVLDPRTGVLSAECKVKGITMNYETSKFVNFTTMKQMVLKSGDLESVKVPVVQFKRTPKFDVLMVEHEKTYRPLNMKRKFLENHYSVPYGYRSNTEGYYSQASGWPDPAASANGFLWDAEAESPQSSQMTESVGTASPQKPQSMTSAAQPVDDIIMISDTDDENGDNPFADPSQDPAKKRRTSPS